MYQILKLVNRLSPEDKEKLPEHLKLQLLRRDIQKAEDERERGEGVPAEIVLTELRQRAKRSRSKATEELTKLDEEQGIALSE